MLKKSHVIATLPLLAALLTSCSMNSSDKLAEPQLTGDAQLTILQTTDVHHAGNGAGHATATLSADVGSYARISAYVNYVRGSAGHPVVLVDSGDWSMGTLYDLTLGTQPLSLYFMDTLKYDCITLGNHEFDFTPKGLATMLSAAQSTFSFSAPMVASNINLNGNADLAPYVGAGKVVAPTRVETLSNGLKVGYIGLMGKNAASVAPASAPVTFTDFSANYTFVQNLVNELRTTEGCNVVVALSHTGADTTGTSGEDVNLAKQVTGIDVIASGHNHNPLPSAKTIPNGSWNTQIVCAGAYGTNVSRIDLTYHVSAKNTTLVASENQAMTDANLTAIHSGLVADGGINFMVRATEAQLNQGLGALFTPIFPDYAPANTSTGIYHVAGGALQTMESNDKNPVLCPNGLGNLCADSVRNVPNGIIVQTLTAIGGDVTKLPGFDFTPYTAGVVATGVIRNTLPAGVALNFTDIYNTLPLGISPDQTQAIPVGYPLMSAYLTGEDFKKLCALQLVAQTGLTSSDYYLNFSGLSYTLGSGSSAYFKDATAAAVLSVTSRKATAGSVAAGTAMTALMNMGTDGGAAMMAAIEAGNVYAIAMAQLNDADLTNATANLGVLGQIATLAATDAATGSISLNTRIVNKAVAAIDTVSAFAPTDAICTGTAKALVDATRYRVSADLYMILMMGAVQAQFGTSITAYKAATGATVLSSADMAGLLANRINLTPAATTVQETKEWMALLVYLITPPAQGGYFTNGTIGAEYASSTNFGDWPTLGAFGPAVQVRSASYPIGSVGQLMSTLGQLTVAP